MTTSPGKPVRTLAAVAASALVVSNGLPLLTPPAFDWIGPAVGLAGLAITAGLTAWTEAKVTPNANVAARVLPAGTVVAGEASDVRTGAPVDITPSTPVS